MPAAADLAWLIPLLPLIGAIFVGLGLISFNRTINRLTKPISFLLITSFIASTIFAGLLLSENISASISFQPLAFLDLALRTCGFT